jgi:SH3 domain protein
LRFSTPLLMLLLLFSTATLAQDQRYVSGNQNVPLRGGAGEDYQLVHRGIPPGTRLIVARTSDDGLWAEITAETGETGWIPTDKLLVEMTPQPDMPVMGMTEESITDADADAIAAESMVAANAAELLDQISTCNEEFNAVAQELHRLKQVSGKAEQLDIDNRRLVEKNENLRSEVEMLQAENHRLLEKVESEDFMNGALAVLLGVIIALVAPRLVPKRRKSSSWA